MVKKFINADIFSDFFIYDKLNIKQIKKGKNIFLLKTKELNNIVITYAASDKALEFNNVIKKGYYSFSYYVGDNFVLNKTKFNSNMIGFFKENEKISGVSSGKCFGIAIYIKKELIKDYVNCLNPNIYTISNIHILDELKYLLKCALDLNDQENELKKIYENIIINKIKKIIMELKKVKNTNSKKNSDIKKFNKISNFLNTKEGQIFPIKLLAKKFNLQERTLRNLFIRQVGISPKKYQKAIQINLLKMHIRNNPKKNISMSISECGLEYQSIVGKDFKNFFSVTPNEYKKNLK